MKTRAAAVVVTLLAPALLMLAACGGSSYGSSGNGGSGGSGGNGGGTSPVNNSLPVASTLGVTGNYANGLFASVTVCVPGTTNCQTIDNVLVDSGSYGLRLLGSQLTVPLPQTKDSSGDPVNECEQFVSTFNWGPVATADVQLAGEKAANVPIQVLGGFSGQTPATVPSTCSSGGLTETDTQAALGANGVLGVGVFRHDCGTGCAPGATTTPPVYFGCPSSGCSAVLLAETDQVQNPVWLFAKDNNGVILQLPQISAGGAATVSGTLIFGLGTQSDNAIPSSVTILGADSTGSFKTTYGNTSYSGSILDSGSNAVFFLDTTTTTLLTCIGNDTGFYCPLLAQSESATNISATTAASVGATWSVTSAETLFSSANAAFNDLAGPNPGSFDYGLSFFFGRNIYFGINGTSAGNVPGPFYGY